MKAFVGNKWRDGFLDYERCRGQYRIAVRACKNLARLDELYIRPKRSLRLVWNYLREIGAKNVWRKIVSRSQESYRNDKFISIGIGEVLEAPSDGNLEPGDPVLFLATCHPPCAERLSLPASMLAKPENLALPLKKDAILYSPSVKGGEQGSWWRDLRGWHAESGWPLPGDMPQVFRNVEQTLQNVDWSVAQELPTSGLERATVVSVEKTALDSSKKQAVLFGYGQYAKTMCLPNIKANLNVARIHEVDPFQIPRKQQRHPYSWSTQPEPCADDHYDVFFIASYHHTHADLAVEALRRGAAAVVEKPTAVNTSQLQMLAAALRTSQGRLFSCYQKRYSAFNELARDDLQLTDNDPVSYHCIVYEIPLPSWHWYRWPNSASRLVSNGCHWLDHFLYLNNFCDASDCRVFSASDGTINCSVELSNRAVFTMALTDQGSRRLGVQDYIELRANGRTVRMAGGSRYTAESEDRILRRRKLHKFQSYQHMYREIARKIAAGEPGDSAHSLEVSTGLVLTLEELLQKFECEKLLLKRHAEGGAPKSDAQHRE